MARSSKFGVPVCPVPTPEEMELSDNHSAQELLEMNAYLYRIPSREELQEVDPYQRHMLLKNHKQRKFLKHYMSYGTITRAARAAAIHRMSHNDWIARNPIYRMIYESLQPLVGKHLENVAIQRAVHGVKKAVYYQGMVVGHEVQHDNRLLFNLLKYNNQRYADRDDKNVINAQGNVQIVIPDNQRPDSEADPHARSPVPGLTSTANLLPPPTTSEPDLSELDDDPLDIDLSELEDDHVH